MKTIISLLMFAGLTSATFLGADAQRRGHDSGGGGNHESNTGGGRISRSFSEGRSFNSGNFSRQNNTFRQNNSFRQNTTSPIQRNERTFTPGTSQNNRSFVYQQRNAITRNDVRVNNTYRRYSTPNTVFNRDRAFGTRTNVYNNYRYNNYGYHYDRRFYGGGYYFYNNRRYSFMYGQRYTFIPRSFLSISFGGFNYYYNAGCYWGYFGGYYQPLFPPFGLHIATLPFGYYNFYWGGYPYYYYNGIYYRYYDDYYEVVDAPVGAVVYTLPEGAKTVVINGETMFELNGTYYKQSVDANGRTAYTVVGKYGVVNNTDSNVSDVPDNSSPETYNNNGSGDNSSENYNQNTTPDYNQQSNTPSLQMGDSVSELPDGSKAVVINGEQLYVTPDNVYLKERADKGVTTYTVVGK